MDSIQLMVDEHVYIKRMLAVLRKYSYRLLNGEQVDFEDFYKMIDFVRNYADKHHHGKEEDFLFNRMVENQGSAAEKLVKNGMLVEHDLGRLHMQELEEAIERVKAGDDESKLDVIANAVSYTHLLHRHIDKEDAVVYKFAQNGLSKEVMDQIDAQCESFEKDATAQGIQDKYIKLLEELENK
ncbi:MAG TPA: hemerythrin [Eubacteriaceae bacterium]|jgi:hemerythrin-like domain-containing protein|nr:hemerythrin [Eubacteriaceae bacterium]